MEGLERLRGGERLEKLEGLQRKTNTLVCLISPT